MLAVKDEMQAAGFEWGERNYALAFRVLAIARKSDLLAALFAELKESGVRAMWRTLMPVLEHRCYCAEQVRLFYITPFF